MCVLRWCVEVMQSRLALSYWVPADDMEDEVREKRLVKVTQTPSPAVKVSNHGSKRVPVVEVELRVRTGGSRGQKRNSSGYGGAAHASVSY